VALSEVRVAHADNIPLAVVRRQVRAAELARVVPEGCGVVWSFVRAQQLRAGRHVAVYWDATIRVEVGVEVFEPFSDGGNVVRSATPAGPAAWVVHLGPYSQLGVAHQAILDWCSAHNRQLAGPSWEIYGHWHDDWNADPSQIRTDVFYQLAPDSASAG
jgi:effector-binding domain-containing protein